MTDGSCVTGNNASSVPDPATVLTENQSGADQFGCCFTSFPIIVKFADFFNNYLGIFVNDFDCVVCNPRRNTNIILMTLS